MATLTCRVDPGEAVKLWPWSKVEPMVRHGGTPAGTPTATATAAATGIASFAGQPSRIEFAVQRANGLFVKVMDSQTRGGTP